MFDWPFLLSPNSPEGQRYIADQMQRGAFAPLYSAETLAAAAAHRQSVDAAIAAEPGKVRRLPVRR